jgi:hypothetical protein
LLLLVGLAILDAKDRTVILQQELPIAARTRSNVQSIVLIAGVYLMANFFNSTILSLVALHFHIHYSYIYQVTL